MTKNPDVVNIKRHRVTYDGDKIYVGVSKEAREIFISSVNDQIPKTAAIYDSLTRMITMSWQHNTTEAVARQLYKASHSKHDLPGILAEMIRGRWI